MDEDIITREISIDEVVEKYVDVEKFITRCRECDSYGRKWSCPPYDFDQMEYWRKFSRLRLMVKKFRPEDEDMDTVFAAYKDTKEELTEDLYDLEKKIPGSRCLFAGSCCVCGEDNCTKVNGEPCRFPDKCRYSVESIGGDVAGLAKDLFGLDLLWMKDGKMPEYFLLMCGLLLP